MMHSNREKGFTLVELIVGVAVSILVLSGAIQLMSSSFKTQTNSTGKIKDVAAGRVAIDNISEELKYAYANSVTAADGSTSTSPSTLGSITGATDISFSRSVDALGTKKTRHIYLKAGTGSAGGTVVINEGPYPQTTIPWTITKTTSYSIGMVRALTFDISVPLAASIIDPDFNDNTATSNNIGSKRKTVTVTLKNNSVPTNSSQPNILTDPRMTVLTTKITTQNLN